MQNNLLKQYLNACKRALTYNFIFSFAINVLMLATSIYSLQILDRVLSSGSLETLMMLSVIMLVVYVILAFLQIIRSFIFNQISNWLDDKLSSPLLESSISFNSSNNSNLGSQNIRDLANIKSFITGQAITHLFDAPWAIVYFAVIFLIHWINGFIVVAGAAILFLLALLNEKLTKQASEKANEINVLSMRKIESISRNAEVIKAMGMRENITKIWQKINQELIKKNNIALSRSSIISSITKSIRLFIQMLTMAVGAVLVIDNKMSAGGIIATSILSGKALAPFDAAVTIYKSMINSKKSYQRLYQSLEHYQAQEDKLELPQPQGKIELEKLVYKLPDSDQMIIKGINLTINAGEIIGIIGSSGSGKTTLARLIVGVLIPDKGAVRIDEANIADQDDIKLGDHIGYLPQDIELFNANIKENISRMSQEPSSEDIIQAANFTDTNKLILKLNKGYETNAHCLSAGQRQRIALARAFYGNPKLVVLDEPNSNLDIQGDNALLKTIQNAKQKQITTIIISHRPTILDNVDKILVIHEGEAKMFDEAHKVIANLSESPVDKVNPANDATQAGGNL